MESSAALYNRLSKPQYDFGCEFLRHLHIEQGYKVLDMGCGTGDLANYIASLVGASGEVIGVDPDEARIKIAQEKYRDVPNLQFFVGDSSNLPLRLEDIQHYDLHFSNFVFQRLDEEKKTLYMKKAIRCLKPGGRIALSTVNNPLADMPVLRYKYSTDDVYVKMCEEYKLRPLEIKSVPFEALFSSYDEFATWFHVSNGHTLESCGADWLRRYLSETIKILDKGIVMYKIDGMLRFAAENIGS